MGSRTTHFVPFHHHIPYGHRTGPGIVLGTDEDTNGWGPGCRTVSTEEVILDNALGSIE